jgi:hypothetical protein
MAGPDPIGANLKGEHPNPRVMAGLDPVINRRTCLARWPGDPPIKSGEAMTSNAHCTCVTEPAVTNWPLVSCSCQAPPVA